MQSVPAGGAGSTAARPGLPTATRARFHASRAPHVRAEVDARVDAAAGGAGALVTVLEITCTPDTSPKIQGWMAIPRTRRSCRVVAWMVLPEMTVFLPPKKTMPTSDGLMIVLRVMRVVGAGEGDAVGPGAVRLVVVGARAAGRVDVVAGGVNRGVADGAGRRAHAQGRAALGVGNAQVVHQQPGAPLARMRRVVLVVPIHAAIHAQRAGQAPGIAGAGAFRKPRAPVVADAVVNPIRAETDARGSGCRRGPGG